MSHGSVELTLKDSVLDRPVPLDVFLQHLYAWWMLCVIMRMRHDPRLGRDFGARDVAIVLRALWSNRSLIPEEPAGQAGLFYDPARALLCISKAQLRRKFLPASASAGMLQDLFFGRAFHRWTTDVLDEPEVTACLVEDGRQVVLEELCSDPLLFSDWPKEFALQPVMGFVPVGAIVFGYEARVCYFGLRRNRDAIELLRLAAEWDGSRTLVGEALVPPLLRVSFLLGDEVRIVVPDGVVRRARRDGVTVPRTRGMAAGASVDGGGERVMSLPDQSSRGVKGVESVVVDKAVGQVAKPFFLLRRDEADRLVEDLRVRLGKVERSVWISAHDCVGIVLSSGSDVERALMRGVSLRVLCTDPSSPAAPMTCLMDRYADVGELAGRVDRVERVLSGWRGRFGSRVEFRLLPFLPAGAFFIADAPDGLVKFEVYLPHSSGDMLPSQGIPRRPHVVVPREEVYWREYFLWQWERYWSLARVPAGWE